MAEKLGIRELRVLGASQNVSDMATFALKELLRINGVDSTEIELLVEVTQTGDYSIPHTSSLVQHKGGLETDTYVFDISLGCSGYALALDTASVLMERNRM